MNELAYTLIIFLCGVIAHELGHYIEYKRQKRQVKIKFNWMGVILIEDKNIYTNTPRKYTITGLMGIIFGLPFFFFIPNGLFIYALMCMIDIVLIYHNFTLPKNEFNKTYGFLLEKEYKSYKNDRKNTRHI